MGWKKSTASSYFYAGEIRFGSAASSYAKSRINKAITKHPHKYTLKKTTTFSSAPGICELNYVEEFDKIKSKNASVKVSQVSSQSCVPVVSACE